MQPNVIFSAKQANCGNLEMPTVSLLVRVGGQVADLPKDYQFPWTLICPAPIAYAPTTGYLSVGHSYFNLRQVIAAEVFSQLKDLAGNNITKNSVLVTKADLEAALAALK